jgi:hypothetical protein
LSWRHVVNEWILLITDWASNEENGDCEFS